MDVEGYSGYLVPDIDRLAEDITFCSQKAGFDAAASDPAKYLLLAVSEVCEAYEELRDGHQMHDVYLRDGKPEGFPVEVADSIIRLLNILHSVSMVNGPLRLMRGTEVLRTMTIAEVIAMKVAFNHTRPPKYGRKF